MSQLPTLLEMLKAGVHFGHQKSRWHPKMQPYLFGSRNGVHVIDLDRTVEQLNKALDYTRSLAAKGKTILFVGTKRQARDIIKDAAEKCGMPFLTERWIGGLITNFEECKRRLKKYKTLKEMFVTGEIEKYTKKEQSTFKKQIEKMDKYLAGLVTLTDIPDALYIADLRVEKTAVAEANRKDVTMIAVCDSNVDPTKVDYPIPANDDAVNAIRLIAELMTEAVNQGKAEFEKNKVAVKDVPMTHIFTSSEKSEKAAAPKVQADKTVKKERRAIRKEEVV
ncbi:MAG: 30S ribosomal protein S2 [Candidatus Magasanikbacteria bacterium RIFCSPLOWO2_02_FULL_44_11]|uniref:Small ribosomal subunit protein uS2 n=2 Tax=Candidatus Magasanikiibacteriota TaxID=1752731 RepID=A0A1F6NAY3_9BACT|nr:MAG: 30S ribosomal protein S2 [Candidatus Magasanikbacteria bacterium RIFCSPHIGHO2_02_FULL_45_10]OGH80958.1 MAG: 30S ribosomal protein S2 [Candidatus Magasanikbacteria bacterium RIFCSPLOWO2_02_FULL_44_11]